MSARWASFAIGVGLMLAPLVLGYGALGPILQDVAVGLLVCIVTLAALEWPPARFGLVAPALWLVWSGRGSADAAAAIAEITAGVLLTLLALVPSARFVPRARRYLPRDAPISPEPPRRADVRA